jgi:catalase
MIIERPLGAAVEEALGMVGEAERLTPARAPIDLDESPALSLIKKAKPTLRGRKVGALITDGVDDGVLDALRSAVEKEGAVFAIVAPKIGGVKTAKGKRVAADHALSSGPSIFFDAVALLPSTKGAELLVREAAAIDWVRDAFGHLKVIGTVEAAGPILEKGGGGGGRRRRRSCRPRRGQDLHRSGQASARLGARADAAHAWVSTVVVPGRRDRASGQAAVLTF